MRRSPTHDATTRITCHGDGAEPAPPSRRAGQYPEECRVAAGRQGLRRGLFAGLSRHPVTFARTEGFRPLLADLRNSAGTGGARQFPDLADGRPLWRRTRPWQGLEPVRPSRVAVRGHRRDRGNRRLHDRRDSVLRLRRDTRTQSPLYRHGILVLMRPVVVADDHAERDRAGARPVRPQHLCRGSRARRAPDCVLRHRAHRANGRAVSHRMGVFRPAGGPALLGRGMAARAAGPAPAKRLDGKRYLARQSGPAALFRRNLSLLHARCRLQTGAAAGCGLFSRHQRGGSLSPCGPAGAGDRQAFRPADARHLSRILRGADRAIGRSVPQAGAANDPAGRRGRGRGHAGRSAAWRAFAPLDRR